MPAPSAEPFDITRAVALHYRVAPMGMDGGVVRLVAAEPLAPAAQAEIQQLAGVRVEVVDVSVDRFETRLAEVYGVGAAAIAEARPRMPPREAVHAPEEGIVRFVDQLITEAMARRATDIHIEPSAEGLRARVRVDGLLQPLPVPPDLALHGRRIAARAKVMAGLDPTPSATPREGAIRFRQRDLRISVLPTPRGESIHVRVLPASREFLTLDDLGMASSVRDTLIGLMRLRSGLVVACGPTGSGKSTTLHLLLRNGVPSSEKIITVEDPVEFELPGTVQVEVSPALSFAQALRAVLRHDPDVVLVGEMRDGESARIAIQAALTGHLVLTSLHTDDEAQAVTRLVQLGMERGPLAAALRAILSQRLVRRSCAACAGSGTMGHTLCDQCGGTGFRGRTGLFRVSLLTAELRQAIEQGASEDAVRELMCRGESLGDQGLRMALQGMTTEAELERALGTTRS